MVHDAISLLPLDVGRTVSPRTTCHHCRTPRRRAPEATNQLWLHTLLPLAGTRQSCAIHFRAAVLRCAVSLQRRVRRKTQSVRTNKLKVSHHDERRNARACLTAKTSHCASQEGGADGHTDRSERKRCEGVCQRCLMKPSLNKKHAQEQLKIKKTRWSNRVFC